MATRSPVPPPIFSEAVQVHCPKCGSDDVARAGAGSRVWCCDDCGFGFEEGELVVGVATFIPGL